MKRYSPEVRNFIMENVVGKSTNELVNLVNQKFGTEFTSSSMKSYKANHKLTSGTKGGNPKGSSRMFPDEIQEFIRRNVTEISNLKLTEMINEQFETSYSVAQIRTYKRNRRLSSGLNGRFEKGHAPANKGQKGTIYPGSEKGWFKKGQIPVNHRPIGSERVNVDGYIEVKVEEPNKWALKHRLVWEDIYGKIPKDQVITFRDGDSKNVNIDNLMMINRSTLAVLNHSGLNQYTGKFKDTAINIAKLKLKTAEVVKSQKRKKKRRQIMDKKLGLKIVI